MPTLILLRHGQSQWNLAHRFTGWVDVDLTEKGEAEARRAGTLITEAGLEMDIVFTSLQARAIRTAFLALAAADQLWIPMEKDWRLNERHYGGLTGLEHEAMREKYGAEQVQVWRRSYDVAPPPITADSAYDFRRDRRYAGIDLPASESLKTTLDRVRPYWSQAIAPRLKAGQTVMVAAHGNSLRAIVKDMFDVSDDKITDVEIPTGNPLLVELSEALNPASARYLDTAAAAPLPPL